MQTEFSAQRPERLFVQRTDVIVPFGYAQHGVPIKDAILYLGADIEPALVIRELKRATSSPPHAVPGAETGSPFRMSVSVTYIAMDKSAFSFKSTVKYRAGGHFKEKQALSLCSQKIMVDDKGDGFQVI